MKMRRITVELTVDEYCKLKAMAKARSISYAYEARMHILGGLSYADEMPEAEKAVYEKEYQRLINKYKQK